MPLTGASVPSVQECGRLGLKVIVEPRKHFGPQFGWEVNGRTLASRRSLRVGECLHFQQRQPAHGRLESNFFSLRDKESHTGQVGKLAGEGFLAPEETEVNEFSKHKHDFDCD